MGNKHPILLLVPILIALVYFYLMSRYVLDVRNASIGINAFPSTMLDWFAIIGVAIFVILSILGVISIYRILKVQLHHKR
jgi:uncharacterized BrkB/YihY/UPF0761 family membrane protein